MAVANVQAPYVYEIDHFRDVRGSSSIPLINNVVSDEDLRKAVQQVKNCELHLSYIEKIQGGFGWGYTFLTPQSF